MQPVPTPSSFAERVRQGTPLLLAYARSASVLELVADGTFDAVVVPSLAQAAAAQQLAVPVLVEAADAATIRRAADLGLAGALIRTAGALTAVDDVGTEDDFCVVADRRVAREGGTAAAAWWTAAGAEARAAFEAGARLVVCDVAAALAAFRPPPVAAMPSTQRPVLLMLAGMLGDGTVWDAVAALVGDVAIPVAARIDLDDSIAGMADSVLAAAPATFFLCGHSLGGIVGLEILRRCPERVLGAVLANTSARAGSADQQSAWSHLLDRVGAGEFEAVSDELAHSNLPVARRSDQTLVEHIRRMARSVGREGLVRQLTAQITRPESRGTLAGIEVPVVVVSASEDQVCPPELQRELADSFPAARNVSVPGAGHMLPLEDPATLASVVRELVTRRTAPAQ